MWYNGFIRQDPTDSTNCLVLPTIELLEPIELKERKTRDQRDATVERLGWIYVHRFSHHNNPKAQMAHPDGCREIRSMVLLSLPVPPMPAIGCRTDGDEHGATTTESTSFCSFDMIAGMLNVSARSNNNSANHRRMLRQQEADSALFDSIDALDEEGLLAAKVWPIFCAYKRAYVGSFALQSDPDLRFEDWTTVGTKTPVWRSALDHAKGHDDLFGGIPDARGKIGPTDTPSYEDLVVRAARRIWLAGRADKQLMESEK